MIENKLIFKRFIEKDEKFLWSGIPELVKFPKKHLIILGLSLILLIGVLIVLLNISRFFFFMFMFSGDVFLILYTIYIITIIQDRRILRKKTEFFITNKRIFAIVEKNKEEKIIQQILVIDIDYYFFRQIRNKDYPVFNLTIKTIPISDEHMKNSLLICQPLKDIKLKELYKVQLVPDDNWRYIKTEFCASLKNLTGKEELSKILSEILGLNFRDLH